MSKSILVFFSIFSGNEHIKKQPEHINITFNVYMHRGTIYLHEIDSHYLSGNNHARTKVHLE